MSNWENIYNDNSNLFIKCEELSSGFVLRICNGRYDFNKICKRK